MNNPHPDKNHRVLIIDDNRSIHADFRKILSPATTERPALDAAEAALFGHPTHAIQPTQFEVDAACQGQEGVLLARKALEERRPYAMAFVDVRMPPGWDGIETTQKLWEDDPNIQIVICTAYSDYSWNDIRERFGNRDGLVILKKPFDTVEALQLAHALTAKWELHQQSLHKIENLERVIEERTRELRKTNEALQSDIAERRQAEEALQKANLDLKNAMERLEDTHGQMLQQARMSALGQMASGIAHGFNNVLMPIIGYSDMLLSEPETLANRDVALPMIKDINTAAVDAKNMVQRLRMIRGSAEISPHLPVDMNDMARNAVEMTRPRWDKELGAKGVRIDVVTNLRATRPALGDVSELREALMNLILNAVDALPEGGSLTLSSAVENGEVVMEVSDTGTGMTDEARKRCLEPFFTTKGVTGTGLGLSIVHGIVTRHNGTMKIDTTLGRGTKIQVRLPCAPSDAPVPSPKHEEKKEDSITTPLRILVVDDEILSLKLVERCLQIEGHSVETAHSGREAIDKANAGVFDLVITDRAMPDMRGDLVARAVKERHAQTPVILLTGFGNLMKDDGEHPEGVDLILSKPVTIHDLRRAVKEATITRRKTP